MFSHISADTADYSVYTIYSSPFIMLSDKLKHCSAYFDEIWVNYQPRPSLALNKSKWGPIIVRQKR